MGLLDLLDPHETHFMPELKAGEVSGTRLEFPVHIGRINRASNLP